MLYMHEVAKIVVPSNITPRALNKALRMYWFVDEYLQKILVLRNDGLKEPFLNSSHVQTADNAEIFPS